MNIRGVTYFAIDVSMDEKGSLIFIPLSRSADNGLGIMQKETLLLHKPYTGKTVGKIARDFMQKSIDVPVITDSLKVEDMPVKVKSWRKFDYDWYKVSVGLDKGIGYEIKPWRREKGKSWGHPDDPRYKLSLDVDDEKLGNTILEAFLYIDRNFGFDKDKK